MGQQKQFSDDRLYSNVKIMTKEKSINIDELLENECSTLYAQEVKDKILKAQARGETYISFTRISLGDAFPPIPRNGASYRTSWFKAYIAKHCPAWSITAPSSIAEVRLKYRN